MIESVAIRNFRCFESLEVHGLKRINLIVGKNSSGKTAFLEALFIAAGGSPELALRIRAIRGSGGVPGQPLMLSVDRNSYESLWSDLFFDFDEKQAIFIELIGSAPNTRSVRIAYSDEHESLTLPFHNIDPASPVIVPIVFEWKNQKGEVYRNPVKVSEQGLTMAGSGEVVPIYYFSGGFATASNPTEAATRFSSLSKKGQEAIVVDGMRKEFPFIKNLSVEMNAGIPMIYASVTYLRRKIPVGVLSGGISKLLSMELALAEQPQGVILVDEIENGFYHARLPEIWSALLKFCQQNDTQLFASTHSQECLDAITPLLKENNQDFCLLKAQKENGKSSAVEVFSGEQLLGALQTGFEIR